MTVSDLPPWLFWLGDHIGPIGGVVGMVTGVAGLLVARSAHRRATATARATSKLDARVEHDRATLEAGKLEDLIATALSRYNSVASMRGTLRSGNTERAEREAAADTAEAARLVAEVTAIDASKFGSQNFEKLADCLAAIRQLQTRITALADKCRAAIATADHERDHLLEDLRVETAARLGQPLKDRLG
jgi:prephenate dehydratase